MSDQPPPPPGSPWPPATPPTEPVPATPPAAPPPPTPPTQPAGTWQGPQPVIEPPTQAIPPVPPTAPPPAPPAPGGGSGGGGGGKGPVVAIVVLVLAILGVGGFLLLGGDDDGDDDDVATEDTRDDEDDDDEETTTTTEEVEETTTTAEETTTTTAVEETTTTAGGGDPGELLFAPIQDDTGQLVVEVPDTWTDVDGTPLSATSPNVQASTDLAAFRQLSASGISYTLLDQPNADPNSTLDFLISAHTESCEVLERQDYSDGLFTGRLQELVDCGGQGIELVVIVASDPQGRSVEVSTVIVPPDPVDEIVQHVIETFNLA